MEDGTQLRTAVPVSASSVAPGQGHLALEDFTLRDQSYDVTVKTSNAFGPSEDFLLNGDLALGRGRLQLLSTTIVL